MKQSQNESTDTDIGLQEQNYIFKAWRDLKDSIFNVLYVLLDNEDDQQQEQEPMLGLILESGVDYCQMLAFPFDPFIMSAWNGGQTLQNVSIFFEKFNIMSYMPGVGFNTFLILLYSLIFAIILVLIDIIYVSYSFSKKRFKFTWPLVILAKLVPLFVTVFFLPITQTLLQVVSCEAGPDGGQQVMSSFPDVVCWKGMHLFHTSVTLLFVFLFVFISSVVALALFEPRMASKKITARQNSTGQVVFIMNKIACQLIFSFTPFKQLWIYAIMLFVLSGWLYWTYNMNDPFYDKRASKFFRILSSYYFWTNFMLLASQLLTPFGFNGGLVIWISGLPFIGIIIGFEHKSNIDQLFSFNLKFKSGEHLESHLRYVLQLLQNQEEDKNSYMLITGYIEKHKEICVEDDCPLKMTKKLNKAYTEKEDLNEKFLLQIERMYKTGIKKYPNCTNLRLSFAFFQLERLKNKNKAYEEFSYALKTDPTFEQQFIIYRFKKIIRENLEEDESQEDKTDLIEIIRFQNHISLCQEAMIRSARLHKDFWTQLKQETPDLKKLNEIGSRITKTINVVKQNYEQIQKINNSVPEVLYCYSLYLMMVTKDTIEGRKLLELSKKIYIDKINVNKREQFDDCISSEIESSSLPVVCVSCKPTSLGKILNLNSLFSQLSGYQREEIVERNFEKIMPDIFKDIHERKIKEWLESDEQVGYVNSNRKGYLKLKSGFVLPVQYQVYFKSSSDSFTVSFQNNSSFRHCCHLILDPNRVIRECSILGHVYFGLDRRILCDEEITIQDYLGVYDLDQLARKNKDNPFEHKIFYEDEEIPCEMSINQVYISLRQANSEKNHEDLEDDAMITEAKRLVGYYVKITLKNSEKIEVLKELKKRQKSNNEIEDESSGSGVLGLYQDPNIFDVLITNLAETKTKNDLTHRFELKFKIKTMRLLNNEIKMVYDQNNGGDFDKNDYGDNEDDDYEMLKLNDDRYHQKIREAINTKLNHEEIAKLTYLGIAFIFLLLLITVGEMLLCTEIFRLFSDKGEAILTVTEESNWLSKYLTATLDQNISYESMAKSIQSHHITIDAQLKVQIGLGNNRIEEMDIRDGYFYFYSRLAQFFHLKGQLDITNLYANYIEQIYPVVQSMGQFTQSSLSALHKIFIIGLFMLAFGLSLIYIVIWLSIRLKIDEKKSNILLWFLDIPVSYVAFLGESCDSYLKGFISIKQVMDKGVKVQEEPLIQDYNQLQGKEDEIQQQQKARKTLILKQRKLTFLSRLKLKHFKMGWIAIFGMVYSVVALSQTFALRNYESFLIDQWIFTSRSVIWANSIHFSYFLSSAGKDTIDGINIAKFGQLNKQKFENTMTQTKLHNFNSDILQQESNPDFYQIVSSYIAVYILDICLYLKTNLNECGKVADSSLRGGYRVYTMHIRGVDISKKDELRQANEKYGSQALISMLRTWKNIVNAQVNKATNLISIIFFVYIFAGILCFIIVWIIYLSSLNTEINQAIRMLNMIPFQLLSSSRKETRNFIVWIIRQANKKKHQL